MGIIAVRLTPFELENGMDIKNIVFDFGGVLIDWNPRYLYRDVFDDEDAMERFLSDVCSNEWNARVDAGHPTDKATVELQARFPEYHDLIGMYYGQWIRMIGGEIENNTAFLAPLKKRHRLFGLTNWSRETFAIVLQKYSFFSMFDGIVVSGHEGVTKPDRRIYELLLARYDLKAAESLFIDDNRVNIEAASELGFGTIHLGPGVDLAAELSKRGLL